MRYMIKSEIEGVFLTVCCQKCGCRQGTDNNKAGLVDGRVWGVGTKNEQHQVKVSTDLFLVVIGDV